MIALQSDCLLFQLTNGESVPCSAEMISVELVGGGDGPFDPEVLRHAAASVFHYFKNELCRETVTVGEFAGALEKVICAHSEQWYLFHDLWNVEDDRRMATTAAFGESPRQANE